MIYLITIIYLAIIALEAPALVKGKKWRELAAFTVLLVIAMVYGYGHVLKLPLPSPTGAIEAVFRPVSEYVEKILS